MKKQRLILLGFVYALLVFVYVAGIAFVLANGERIFGKMQNFFGPLFLLLLLVLLAAVVGSLIFIRPVMLYLSNLKREAIYLLVFTLTSLFFITAISVVCYFLFR